MIRVFLTKLGDNPWPVADFYSNKDLLEWLDGRQANERRGPSAQAASRAGVHKMLPGESMELDGILFEAWDVVDPAPNHCSNGARFEVGSDT